jgi:phage tail sheath protein FI
VATYLSPGVYVEEVSTGPKPIAGLPTNIASIVGMTERGPVLEPTRLASWNDYLANFGGYTEGSYTAESAYGFFENGGTALWVVRADNATPSTWDVADGAGNNQAFVISAASPGAWSADMNVQVARDAGGGQGRLFSAKIVADVALTQNQRTTTVSVDSSSGAAPGMRVRLQDAVGGTFDADVVSVGTGQLGIQRGGTAAQSVRADRDGRIFLISRANDPSLPLASGSGFQDGDAVRALTPSGKSLAASVASAQSTGVGMLLTFGADKFSDEVPGMELVARTILLSATIAAAKHPIAATDIVWPTTAPPLVSQQPRRLISPGGDEASWDGSKFPFAQDVPAGPVQLEVGLFVAPFSETFNPALPLSDTEIANRYAFLPTDASIVLTDDSNTTYTLKRQAAAPGFSNAGATGPFKTGGPFKFTKAEYTIDLARPIVLEGPGEPQADDWIDFGGATGRLQIATVTQPGGTPSNVYVVTLVGNQTGTPAGSPWPVLAWQPTRIQPLRFRIDASATLGAQTVSESFPNLSLNPDSHRYYQADGIVNGASALIEVGPRLVGTPADTVDALPVQAVQSQAGRAGSIDGARLKAGIDTLETQLEAALIACPDSLQLQDELDQADVMNHMIDHATKMRRFAVIDLPEKSKDLDLVNFRLTYLDSTYAAAYAPFVRMVNPRPNPTTKTVDVPPSGFAMGVFARTDDERGVWKAPANERVTGIVGLSEQYTKGRQDFLNPRGINLLRSFPGRGTRIWGARNLTDDTQWRYVNVRRLFLMLENSIDVGTQWVVFEPNDANTWLRVRVSVENFLNGIWRAGGLAGATPDQAYRVRVGLGQTMTETDTDLGLLIVEIGVAPVKPAEFVVFRISHKRLTE